MKDIYIEKEREISVIADVDVLVCGGGPAGVGAAEIGSGRVGAKGFSSASAWGSSSSSSFRPKR